MSSEKKGRSLLKANRCFGGKCHVSLQDRIISEGRKQHEAGSKEHAGFMLGLFFHPEDESNILLRDVR
jgi:hypothetical protein